MTREELGAKVRRLQQAVAEVHGKTQLDGVNVRTDANGRLTELSIAHDAWSRGPEALADLIARAYRQAADDVRQRSTAIMAELRDDPIVARIADATIGNSPAADTHADQRPAPVTRGSLSGELCQPDLASLEYQSLTGHSSGHRMIDERDDVDGYFGRKSWLE
ncbi:MULTISPECIES: YbaB/EbfC family nucleoid-associated protein [unclassified Rhodococcus (in: high G+C Gram-positive bacteria)]|uniref:YbaB/EbfC family nucleoid-associated protein n=1 Tax=unclassified Rhodococcus (in: high G+C Gram-positive bacteria) TaxID=192944 RepID=UPI001448082E|nr:MULTISPECIES: YbaB/EbfC family nucleoid-associated protein [unclassified Rhodococcus (in: high G+C Gram-positive bacteria)]